MFRIEYKKSSAILMIVLVLALALSACGNDGNNGNAGNAANAPTETNNGGGEQAEERVVTDSLGNEVTIPANPERVLASYLEDHLIALGVTPVAQWSVANGIQEYLQPEGLEGVPTISYNLPPEEVISFDPDFILIGSESLVQNDLYAQYSKIAPTYVLGDELLKDWRQTLLKIGELLNKSEEAEQALADYDQKIEDTKSRLEPIVGGKSAAILWLTQKQFYMVDEQLSSGTVLYGELGFAPPNLVLDLPEEAKATWNPVTMEKLAELDADYIFLVNSDGGQDAEALQNPVWQTIPAVQNDQVYEISYNSSWLYSGAIAGSRVMDDLVELLAQP